MGKSDYDYLEEERKKLWQKVNAVEADLHQRIDAEIAKNATEHANDARQASKKASEYRNKSEESRNTISKYLSEAETQLESINQLSVSTKESSKQIEEHTAQVNSNNENIKNIYDEVRTRKESFEEDIERLEEIFEDFDDLDDKLSKLKDILSESEDTSSKIETLHKSLLGRKKEIDKLYYDIFGYKESEGDIETEVEGLKDKLEKAYDELSRQLETATESIESIQEKSNKDFDIMQEEAKSRYEQHTKSWDSQYHSLSQKIEALLPNALTAGLSSAFSEKKNVEIEEYKKLNYSFIFSILGLVLVSLIPFAVSLYSIYDGKTFEKALLDIPRVVLAILPLYIPVLWIAYSSNRKMNLSKRLSEEYSHKEVLSKTFEGLASQINNISDEKISSDLRNKLLYNLLEVSSENPGKLISDYNKSDHPIMDALDKSVKLASAFEKLEKIPGFSKLADKMNNKSKAILREENEKANRGLNVIEDEEEEEEEEAKV